MLIIVSAEDLGTESALNDEIFSLIESKTVTSATVIANGPAFAQAAKAIAQFPECSFGVHLNLTVFPPLRPSLQLEPILDENGSLSPKLFKTRITPQLQRAVFDELTAQVERALLARIPVSHFDSHQHIHTLPLLFPVLKALQRRFGIRRVRSTINLLPPGQQLSPIRWFKKRLFCHALRWHYRTASPAGLGEFRDFYAGLEVGQLPRFRELELMVHPGTTAPTYMHEVALLRSDWRRRLPLGIAFGNYYSIS
jgi:chitin disaccharide deacetylase